MSKNNDKEEEQLLQDASTLLMFANVAAKQQQEQLGKKASPTPPPPHITGPAFQSNRPSQHLSQSPVNLFQPLPPHSFGHQLQLPLNQSHPQHQQIVSENYGSQKIDRALQEKFQAQQSYITSEKKVTPPAQPKSLPESSRSSISENFSPALSNPADFSHLQGRNVPPHRSFGQQGHKRSLSSPGEAATMAQSPPLYSGHSPGPASVALSRGINVESGKRNNNNAMIAAAALAAAADIPLPLLKKGEERSKYQNETLIDYQKVNPHVKKEDAQVEESVMTEPEEDINETDDEQTIKQKDNNNASESINDKDKKLEENVGDKLLSPAITTPIDAPKQTDLVTTSIPQSNELPVTSSKFIPPPLSSYQVDPDSGLIGCICGIEDDDGFTIQCDVCFRWQHCLCMDFGTNDEVPEDEYKCYYCDEAKWGKFDANQCRVNTLQRLEIDKLPDKNELAEEAKSSNKRKNLNPDLKNEEKKKRRASEKHDNPQEKNQERKQLSRPDVTSSTDATIDSNSNFLPNFDNELLDNGVSAEPYQSVYYKLKSNDYKKLDVRHFFDDIGKKFYERYCQSSKKDHESLPVEVMTNDQINNLKFSNVILPNKEAYLRENKEFRKKQKNNGTSIQVKLYSENQKQKFNGITRLGLFITEKTGKFEDEFIIPEETPIIEYLGEIDLFDNYKHDSVNQYPSLGTSKPKVLKFNLNTGQNNELLEIVSDSRFVGNESRFIRKSCPATSNCKIKAVYIPQTNSFKFLVVTSKPIILSSGTKEEELRLDWEWDHLHPIRRMYSSNSKRDDTSETLKFDQFSDEDKAYLITSVDNILHFVECGCSTASSGIIQNSCAIFKVKKATSYLLRSTRKASSISSINLAKSREELIMPKRSRKFISWEERLIERDQIIQMNLHVTTNTSIDSQDMENNQEISEEETASHQEGNKDIQLKSSEDPDASKPVFFTLPYKQQLIARGRKLAKEYRQESLDHDISSTFNDDNGTVVESPDFVSVSIPVVPELVTKIRQRLDREIEPITKIGNKDPENNEQANNLKGDATLSRSNNSLYVTLNSSITPSQSAGTKFENSSTPTAEVPKEEKSAETPPPVVKKLSFADYKRKMK